MIRPLSSGELAAFRREHGAKIEAHQRIVGAMRAAGISMLRTEPIAMDARPRFSRGRDEEHGVISEREGARNYGSAHAYEPASHEETVDAESDLEAIGATRDYLRQKGLSEDDLSELAELMGHSDEVCREADDYHRRQGRDEPEPFKGMPRPGGTSVKDAIKHVVNGRRPDGGLLAGDRAPGASYRDFARRFPGAARIKHV